MKKELGLSAIVHRKKITYQTGKPHKVFPNLFQQDFVAEEIDQKWCTDFTYLSLADGSTRYNCSIMDLHDRSIVASMTDKQITSDLAIRTLKKALESQQTVKVLGASVTKMPDHNRLSRRLTNHLFLRFKQFLQQHLGLLFLYRRLL